MKKVQRFEELNWKEIENLDKEKTLILIPMSPPEAHGPHLPIGTDMFVTEEISKEVIIRLKKKRKRLNPILYPTLVIGYCGANIDIPGSVSVDVKTFERLVYDTLKSLSNHGFRYVMIVTFHADPFYIKAIHRAMDKIRKSNKIKIVEPLSKLFFNNKENITHGGKEETSLMLYLYPYLVDKNYRSLGKIEVSFSPLSFRKTLKELGAIGGYIGNPSEANIEIGRKLFNWMVNLCVETALKLMESEYEDHMPRPLNYLPLFLQRRG